MWGENLQAVFRGIAYAFLSWLTAMKSKLVIFTEKMLTEQHGADNQQTNSDKQPFFHRSGFILFRAKVRILTYPYKFRANLMFKRHQQISEYVLSRFEQDE